jgi:hypothetical protein
VGCPAASPPYEPRAYEPLTSPAGDAQIVAETLENAEHNLEAAIRCLEGLRLSAASRRAGGAGTEQSADSCASHDNAEASSSAAAPAAEAAGGSAGDDGGGMRMAPERLSAWAGQLVQEMQGASDLAQAHARAGHLLQQFEGDVTTKVVAAATAENASLQNHVQALARDNTILKRAVAVQNQRRQVCTTSSQEELRSWGQPLIWHARSAMQLPALHRETALQSSSTQRHGPRCFALLALLMR